MKYLRPYVREISSAKFDWTPGSQPDEFNCRGLFTAEVSDLGNAFMFCQLYDDACDEGLVMVSARTGARAVFALRDAHRDAGGDVMWWTLTPTMDTVRRLPALTRTKMVVFND